jgi:hypothetical protein
MNGPSMRRQGIEPLALQKNLPAGRLFESRNNAQQRCFP